MKKNQFVIKPTENGHGIFLRTMQARPLAVFPTKEAAKQRLRDYLRKVNGGGGMTNGLVKERLTYFHKNGTAYQSFNTIMGTAKVFVYVKIDHRYVLAANFTVDHRIESAEALGKIADEHEANLNE